MSQRKPNVIIALCDQLRPFEVGCYGNNIIRTPNIDRLAANGVRFDTACSNNPVCSPARSILLSGQYTRTCMGYLGNAGEPIPERRQLLAQSLPEAFKSAGYNTGLIGKWHIGPHPSLLGFDHMMYPLFLHRYTGQTFLDSDGNKTLVPGFTADYELQGLKQFIRERKEEPFFLYYNISQPHMPLDDMPEKYRKMYSRDEVPLRRNVLKDGKAAYDDNWFKIYLWDHLYYQERLPHTEKLPDGFDLRDLTALYYGSATWADDQVGHLMRLLEEQGIAENTIVLFTSDHGDLLGSHQLFNKDQLYEEAIRIPMIFHWPDGLGTSHITTQTTSLVDIMPTLLSLAEIDTPSTAQGTDLSPVLKDVDKSAGENLAFIETSMGDIGIRTPTHIYGMKKTRDEEGRTGYIEDDRHMFFDLQADPLQESNIAKTEEQETVAESLRNRLILWDQQTKWMGAAR